MALEAAAGDSFHPALVDHAVVKFMRLTRRLGKQKTLRQYGKGYSKVIENYDYLIDQFANAVISARLPMRLYWRKLEQSLVGYFLEGVKTRLGLAGDVEATHLLASPELLVPAAKHMHDRMFSDKSRGLPVLLNQAGSGWNPVESTKYFSGRKVVLVKRDPRDQYAELKKYKKASDAHEFVKWYRELSHRLKEIDDAVVLKINFEEFVMDNERSIGKVCDFLGLDEKTKSSYDPMLSMSNVGVYENVLSSKELSILDGDFAP